MKLRFTLLLVLSQISGFESLGFQIFNQAFELFDRFRIKGKNLIVPVNFFDALDKGLSTTYDIEDVYV